jgi:hypothetical protein
MGLEERAFSIRPGRESIRGDIDADDAEWSNLMLLDGNRPTGATAFAGVGADVESVGTQAADGHANEFQNVRLITKLIERGDDFRAFVGKCMQRRRRIDCFCG